MAYVRPHEHDSAAIPTAMLIIPYLGPPDGAQGFLRVSRAILAHVRLKGMGEGPGLGDGPKAPGKVRPALKLRAHGLVSCYMQPTF